MTKPYLIGALHDASTRKHTYRICQKSKQYVEFIAQGIKTLGSNAWTYREGKDRNLYVVEFSRSLIDEVTINSRQDEIEYLRGYFDTDGGIAKQSLVRFYIYFAQKNLLDVQEAKEMLEKLGIACGKIHNPSQRVAPNYWRFYVRTKSHSDFARIIGSWHHEKQSFLRMKI